MNDEPLLSEKTWVKTSLAKFAAAGAFIALVTWYLSAVFWTVNTNVKDLSTGQDSLKVQIAKSQTDTIEKLNENAAAMDRQLSEAAKARSLLVSKVEMENQWLRFKIKNPQLDVPEYKANP